MNVRYVIIIVLVVMLGASCGFRTAPTAYPERIDSLPKIESAMIRFRGDHMVISWQSPVSANDKKDTQDTRDSQTQQKPSKKSTDEKDPDQKKLSKEPEPISISYFRVSFIKPVSCYACTDKELISLFIRVEGQHILDQDENLISPSEDLRLIKENSDFRLIMSPAYVSRMNLPSGYYVAIDYLTEDGEKSKATGALTPRQPSLIPLPKVDVQVLEINQLKEETKKRTFRMSNESDYFMHSDRLKNGKKVWLFTWRPIFETIRHSIDKEGTLNKSRVVYGLQFFYIDSFLKERAINEFLLYEGSFALVDLNRSIYARHVDRFGNQSKKMSIYQISE